MGSQIECHREGGKEMGLPGRMPLRPGPLWLSVNPALSILRFITKCTPGVP
jgi:hypothetical protein